VPARDLAVPARFLEHGKVAQVRADVGLTAQDIARQLLGWVSGLDPADVGSNAQRQDAP
jgi:1-deoxy-D-xylulose-5-phosphate synthase